MTKAKDQRSQSMKEQAYNMKKTKDSRTQRQSNLYKSKAARFKISRQEFEDHTFWEIVSLKYVCEHGSSESTGSPMRIRIIYWIRSELFGLMFNVMKRMMGGKSFYGLTNGKSKDEKRFQDIVTATTKVNSQASIVDMFPNLLWLVVGKLEKKYVAVQKRRDDLTQEWNDEFRADGLGDGEGKKTFLRVLLSLQDEDSEYYTNKEIKSLSHVIFPFLLHRI
nr:cytochrome P450 81E8-like [Tanacetum cinerariifolium]